MNSLTVPATLDSLVAIASFVAEVTDAAGLSEQPAYCLRLAVDEFATNIIMYAYEGAAWPGMIELRAEMDEQSVRVVLEDRGRCFDPGQVPPPPDLHLPAEQRRLGGLGVHLALRSVDYFAYKRIGNRNRNVLGMTRSSAGSPHRE